jgi:hypothetical protein
MMTMTTPLGWTDMALRLALTVMAGILLGYNRSEHGKAAGMRTTLLVCPAASIAMLQVNLLRRLDRRANHERRRLRPCRQHHVGFIGALIGGWLFDLCGIAVYGLIGSIIAAVIGAIVLLALLRLIRRVQHGPCGYVSVGEAVTSPSAVQSRTPRLSEKLPCTALHSGSPVARMRHPKNSRNRMITNAL